MSARAELSSVSTAVEDLLKRVTEIVDGLASQERGLMGPDLFEVERSLRSAQRRLRRIVDKIA
ncbi:MAG TPA: hypothetical protein VNF71_16785 [Acidimicrobiales bacterium]|nr:hypothetical protein [Acidimicrobiales bacterium]